MKLSLDANTDTARCMSSEEKETKLNSSAFLAASTLARPVATRPKKLFTDVSAVVNKIGLIPTQLEEIHSSQASHQSTATYERGSTNHNYPKKIRNKKIKKLLNKIVVAAASGILVVLSSGQWGNKLMTMHRSEVLLFTISFIVHL